jgi:hypothetical protein
MTEQERNEAIDKGIAPLRDAVAALAKLIADSPGEVYTAGFNHYDYSSAVRQVETLTDVIQNSMEDYQLEGDAVHARRHGISVSQVTAERHAYEADRLTPLPA